MYGSIYCIYRISSRGYVFVFVLDWQGNSQAYYTSTYVPLPQNPLSFFFHFTYTYSVVLEETLLIIGR